MDYEVEYNNRARVPENPAIIAGWSRDATAYREAHQARLKVIPYGTGERNRIDLFSGDGAGAIVVFIHGGYWQALDGSFFSHLAAGLNAHGIDVAVPSYDLCPAVSVAEIIVSGHSAGGHLAACLLATDWRAFDASLPDELVTAAHAISGLFDLRPLVSTSINTALKLDDASARAVSPLFWKSPSHGALDAVVGGNESAEYLRQSRTIVDAWSAAGIATRFATIPDANHFTAIAPFADPNSPMTLRLKQLAGR